MSGSKRPINGGQRLVDQNTGLTVVERLELATSFWQRFCGWQLRGVPVAGNGLLIAPCNSIHTFGMRFAIDVAFLAENGIVLTIRPHVAPWQIVPPVREASAVLEVPSGRCVIQKGQRLGVELASGDPLPRLAKGLLSAG